MTGRCPTCDLPVWLAIVPDPAIMADESYHNGSDIRKTRRDAF